VSKRKSIPYMPMYWEDLLSSGTWIRMGAASKGIYMELMAVSWCAEWLPVDLEELRRTAKADKDEWRDFVKFVDDVFPIVGDRRANPRQETEREKAFAHYNARRENGALGGRPKKPRGLENGEEEKPRQNLEVSENADFENLEETKRLQKQGETITETKPHNTEPRTHNLEQKDKSPDGGRDPNGPPISFSDFKDFLEAFALAYPGNQYSRGGKQIGRAIPEKVQAKLKKLWKVDGRLIVDQAVAYGKMLDWKKSSGQFCPSPRNIQTWVNQDNWKDDYTLPEEELNQVRNSGENSGVDIEGVHWVWGEDGRGEPIKVRREQVAA